MADEIEQDRNVVNIELQTVESHAAGTNCIADFVEKSPENIQNVKRLKKLVQLADANVNFQSDKDGTTALHSAVLKEKAEFVDVLLEAGAEIKQDTDGNTALHYAVEHTSEAEAFDKFERLMPRKILANERWDWKFKREQLDAVTLVNNKGFNILNLALELGKMKIFEYIVQKTDICRLMELLRNNTGRKYRPPFRALIEKMPEIAKDVMDKCITRKENRIIFNYEFLDDTFYQESRPLDQDDYDRTRRTSDREDEEHTNSMTRRNDNHPLKHMATDRSLVFSKDLLRFPGFKGLRIWWFILFIVYCNHIKGRRTESDGEIHHQLLDHPLVKALVRRKWNDIGVKFHVLNLALYMIYLVVLTVCVCTTVPPYINSQSPNNLFTYLNTTVCQNVTLCQNETSCQNGNTCKNTTKCLDTTTCLNKTTTEAAVTKMACHSFESQRMSVIVDLQYFVIALSFIMILKEIYQLVRVYGREYFKQKENYVELAVYIFSVLFVVNVTECEHTDYRTEWQWALGTLSVFMAWINLLVFGKKFEHLGIYVMMLWSIIKTFLVNVFPIVAVLLMAFSIAFTCVHQDQMKFANVWHSLLTTSSLMISGFDYDEFLSLANYHDIASVSYIIYSLFQLLMTIVIINLMVGVAVENVQEIHKDASATNTVLQIEYILELERMICLISTKLKNICKIKEFMERFISKQKEEIELTQLQSTRLPVQQIMAVLDKNKAENEQDGILERINQIEMTMTKKLNTIGKQMTEINFMIERQLTLLNSTTKDTNERMSTVETRLIELNSTTKETNESINTVET